MQRHPRTAGFSIPIECRSIDHRHASELARIREAHRGPVDETDLAPHVALVYVGHPEQELSGHAQRDDEGLAAIEIEHDELAAAPHVADAPPAQARTDDLRRPGLGEAHPARLELADRSVDDEPAQLPRAGIDFGTFRPQ